MRQDNVKQHYVPQFYLRNFSSNDQLNVFHIYNKNKYKTNIKDAGCEKLFYDVDTEIISAYIENNNISETFIDDMVRKENEELCAPLIKEFNIVNDLFKDHSVDVWQIPDEVFSILIDFIIVQYVRTPRMRKNFTGIAELVQNNIRSQKLPPKIKNLNIENWTKHLHNVFLYKLLSICNFSTNEKYINSKTALFDELLEEFKKFKKELESSFRYILHNESDKYFMASDSPVCVDLYGGKMDQFKLVFLPINKNLSVTFLNKEYFPDLQYLDKRIQLIDNDNTSMLDNFNLFVTKMADQRIYSYLDDFELVNSFVSGKINLKLSVY